MADRYCVCILAALLQQTPERQLLVRKNDPLMVGRGRGGGTVCTLIDVTLVMTLCNKMKLKFIKRMVHHTETGNDAGDGSDCTPPYLTLPYLTLPNLTLPYLTLPNLT